MKTILLAAAAMIAFPAIAQTTGSASNTTATMTPPIPVKEREVTGLGSNNQQMPNTTQQAPMQNMSAPDDATSTATTTAAPDQGTATTTEPMPATPPAGTTGGTMSPGGYQPSGSMPMAQPGGQPAVFTPGPSVEQAYPAPAPLASYPICKKGQYDKCMQRGGK